MADFWNNRAMRPPATCNVPYSAEEQREGKVIHSLQIVVEVLDSFQSMSEAYKSLDAERYVLARLVYRSNNQFRSDKRLQMMKKIDQCLKRNAAIKIQELVVDLQQCFPGQGVCDFHPHFSNAVFIPSRQMYQHLLAKCVGSAALLGRCASLCLDTFLHVRQVLGLGHFLTNMSVLAANLSRIWLLCRHLIMETNVLYMKLHAIVDHLRPVATPWIPKGASLPSDLSRYLIQRADEEKAAAQLMMEAAVEHGGDEETADDDAVIETAADAKKSKILTPLNSATQEEDEDRKHSVGEDVGVALTRNVDAAEDLGVPMIRDAEKNNAGSPKAGKRKKSEERGSTKKKKVEHVMRDKTAMKRKHEPDQIGDSEGRDSISTTSIKKKKKKKKKNSMEGNQEQEQTNLDGNGNLFGMPSSIDNTKEEVCQNGYGKTKKKKNKQKWIVSAP